MAQIAQSMDYFSVINGSIPKPFMQDNQYRLEAILHQNQELLTQNDDYSDLSKMPRIGSGSQGMPRRDAQIAAVGLVAVLVAFGYVILNRPGINNKIKAAWYAASSGAIKAYEILTGTKVESTLGNDPQSPEDTSPPSDAPSYWPTPEQLWYLQCAIGLALVLYGTYELYQTWNLGTELAELEAGAAMCQEKISQLAADRQLCIISLDALRDACDENSNPTLETDAKLDFLSLMEQMIGALRKYRNNIRGVRSWLQENVVAYETKAREISQNANSRAIRTGVLAVAATACLVAFQPGLPVALAGLAGAAGIAGAYWSTHQVRRAREVVENLEKCEQDLDKHREGYNKLLSMFRELSQAGDLGRLTRQEVEIAQLRAELAKLKAM